MSEENKMSADDREQVISEFLLECDANIQILNEKLLSAEELINGNKEVPAGDLNEMFRTAHTIKGSSSFLGLQRINHLTHEIEAILDRLRNQKLSFSLPVIDALFFAFDVLESLANKLRTSGTDDVDIEAAVGRIQGVLDGKGQVHPPVPPPPAEKPSSKEIDVEKYIIPFIESAEQGIARFNELLLVIESGTATREHWDELFRIAHTLKGSAGMIRRQDIEQVAHRMEDLLFRFRDGGEKVNANHIASLFRGIDGIKSIIEEMKKGKRSNADITPILEDFQQCLGEKKEAPAQAVERPKAPSVTVRAMNSADKNQLKKAFEQGADLFLLTIRIKGVPDLRGVKKMLVEERLGRRGQIIKCSVGDDEIAKKGDDEVVEYLYGTIENEKDIRGILSIDEVEVVEVERENMEKWKADMQGASLEETIRAGLTKVIQNQDAGKIVPSSKVPEKSPSLEMATIRIDSRKLDKLMNSAGELVITRAYFAQLMNGISNEISKFKRVNYVISELSSRLNKMKMNDPNAAMQKQGTESKKIAELQKAFEDVKNRIREIEAFVDVKAISQKAHNLDEATDALGKLSSEIQSGIMQTRMIPIEGLFTRFKRVVRDMSKDFGKGVVLDIYGEETELDKKIIDDLNDPLTHMIRNAFDHGIEPKEVRLRLGKKEVGTIRLGASHRGNSICIEISDDGKGLDTEVLTEKAIQKGLLSPEKAAQMSEREKLNIIFMPGFSTAERVTGLSGRGVGMDVVKNMITSLKGTVDIETKVGEGTTFVLKIPLTLAIISALLVEVGSQIFAIPLETVAEIIKISSEEIYYIEGNAMVKLRGHALSLIELENVIKVRGNARDEKSSKKVVVITDGDNRLGVIVDHLLGEDEIVIKALTKHFSKVRGVSGASILGDGKIALILDSMAIIKESQ